MVVASAALELRPATEADVEPAVALHRRAIPYSLNSRLGAAHLARAYRVLGADATSMVVVAARAATVVGVVVASLDPGALERRILLGIGPRGWLGIAAGLARRPALLAEILRPGRPVAHAGRAVVPRLIAIAVDAAGRERGVGRALVGAVDDFCRRRGVAAYHLDTRADNAAALAFYSRCGFVEVERRGRDVVLVKELA
jgi:ribosomal protein S18 acetylase RimI-like enzyme